MDWSALNLQTKKKETLLYTPFVFFLFFDTVFYELFIVFYNY